MKTLLLVGASGFLGSHIKLSYQNLGWNVVTLGRNKKSDFVFDANNLDQICQLPIDIKIDRVINAAAVNETLISDHLVCAYNINVSLTRILLELARIHKIPEFIYISTFHVYGKADGEIGCTTVKKPKNDYALTHYLSENIVNFLGDTFGIKTLIVRPTNIYGIPIDITHFNRWSLVPFEFVRDAVNLNSIKIRSSGLQQRNFVGVNDVIAATHLIDSSKEVNAYGNDTITIRDFSLMIANINKELFDKNCIVEWGDECLGIGRDLIMTEDNLKYEPREHIKLFVEKFLKALYK